jgi:hypothetical protein
MQGFIFGKGTPWTYEQLQRKREIADALAASLGTPRNVGEGLTAIGKALASRGINKKADKRDTELKGEFDAQFNAAFGGYGSGGGGGYGGGTGAGIRSTPSGTWTPADPGPTPVDIATQGMDVAKSGGLSFGGKPAADPGVMGAGKEPLDFGAAVMTPQEMLIEGAKRRGLDPVDVATAISYETGGKFDPTIKGPTTQWGTHEGLIQFGDPQGEKYGVDFSSPDAAWRTQLNPESGGVWRYLEDTGVKPGMGLPEIYSAINAGSVGRMGASDADNGGAPGTVADKVASMGPHREKAAQFLGGTWTPTEGGGATVSTSGQPGGNMFAGGGGMDLGTLASLAGNPYATPGQKAVLEALIGQQTKAMDPVYNLDLQKAQLELKQMQNPTAKPGFTQLTAQEVQQLGLPPGVYQRGPDGRIDTIEKTQGPADPIADLKARAAAAGLQEGTPEFQQFMLNNGKAPEGMVIESDGQGGFRMVQGAGAGSAASKPFTEGQSKDVVYATRAEGALAALDPIAESLTGRMDVAKGYVPFGLGAESQNPDYQVAKTAGDEFLQAILRKDTGAAITADEQALYGETYLPRPGDGPDRLAYKAQARKRAVEALKAGMTPAAIVAQERALQKGGSPAKADGASLNFSKMSIAEVGQVDIGSLTPEQMDALEARMTELGL